MPQISGREVNSSILLDLGILKALCLYPITSLGYVYDGHRRVSEHTALSEILATYHDSAQKSLK
jgi:hypothetical protein